MADRRGGPDRRSVTRSVSCCCCCCCCSRAIVSAVTQLTEVFGSLRPKERRGSRPGEDAGADGAMEMVGPLREK
ncbi:hypothetical protein BO94DRAFT_245516 [Aspergillus sclerotioniger CBS 115572]|uniref:Uncharacterized protein n=1 Tax=Aspergillus sclerotioniger CBS 115572 TaxID=1450535 RepID=A0A317VHX0_9EURO|nr:hypothetical protein BO94DRAFT_245516 [Aspergillus sclerotioniger CBS 115572]PWY72482.1 hypothetical protein BO94DRAFT_245516 [Aspergillus sclerotioniger CBS 115572]